MAQTTTVALMKEVPASPVDSSLLRKQSHPLSAAQMDRQFSGRALQHASHFFVPAGSASPYVSSKLDYEQRAR